MYQLNHTYSIRATELRRAIDPHKEWIEKQLGISLADAVIIATDISFCDAAIPSLIGFADPSTPVVTAIRRLRERIQSVQVPPSHVPLIALEKERALDLLLRRFKVDRRELSTFSMEWADGPVGIRLRDLSVPIVALSASYHEGPNSSHEAQQELVVIAREGISGFIELLKTLTATDSKSRLHVGNDRPRPVARCDWDQLVLDPSVVALLRNDFDSFFEREAWFRKMRLPFRRGYLLQAPPAMVRVPRSGRCSQVEGSVRIRFGSLAKTLTTNSWKSSLTKQRKTHLRLFFSKTSTGASPEPVEAPPK